jgi:hypothetical protein
LAKKLDNSVAPNEISLEEIIKEVSVVKEEKPDYGKEGHS